MTFSSMNTFRTKVKDKVLTKVNADQAEHLFKYNSKGNIHGFFKWDFFFQFINEHLLNSLFLPASTTLVL